MRKKTPHRRRLLGNPGAGGWDEIAEALSSGQDIKPTAEF
jgi:hypothetical protein